MQNAAVVETTNTESLQAENMPETMKSIVLSLTELSIQDNRMPPPLLSATLPFEGSHAVKLLEARAELSS